MKTGPTGSTAGAGGPRAGLEAFFRPRTVALIGASEKPGSVGRALMENLRAFPGGLFPVNPRHDFLFDRRAYPAIGAVPEQVDLAVIAVAPPVVPDVVRQCVEAGVAAAVIITAGFKECGPAGVALERQVLAEAARGPLRLIGPNCLGVMNPHAGLNATFAATPPQPGHLAFLSQSGALCSAVLDWSRRENVGFSAFVSVGSMLDVGWGDLITALGDDPHTHSILLYMESVGDARAFLAAARRVAPAKPIIALKVGRTAEAARAAASHTGALTERDDVFDAALRRAGVLRVDAVADLFGMAGVLARQPVPAGPRLAIVTNAGGPGALAADALVLAGGRVAPLSPATRQALDALLPAPWSRGNPVDILGDASPTRFAQAIEIVAREPQADGVLTLLTTQTMTDPTATAERLKEIAARSPQPFFACWMGGDSVVDGRRILYAAGIPTFAYPEAAARAFASLWRVGDLRRGLRADADAAGDDWPAPPTEAVAEAAATIAAARQAGRTVLSEHESKRILALHGIPCVETRLAFTEDEAAAAAVDRGFPVALKLHSHSLTHKSDAGGVRLGLRDEAGVRAAWRAIRQDVGDKAGPEHFLGVTVQRMVASDGREVILGSSTDPHFGPVLLFGSGGRFVEVFKDCAVGLPPLDPRLARQLMEQTKVFAALQGVRGLPPVELPWLERLLVRFGRLAAEQEGIREIDLNPLVIADGRLVALDARIILHPAGVAGPRPVLLP